MTTFNAGLIAPVGYARTYNAYVPTGCGKHATYTPFCESCGYFPRVMRVELSGDIIALILDREDGSVVEWLTVESGVEFAQNVAHSGIVVIREDVWDDLDAYPVAGAVMAEARLVADCFDINTPTLPVSA